MFKVYTIQTCEAWQQITTLLEHYDLNIQVTTPKSNTVPTLLCLSISSGLFVSEDQTAVNTINSKQQ